MLEITPLAAEIMTLVFSTGILVGIVTMWLGIQIGLYMRQKAITMIEEAEKQQLL